MTYYRIRLLPSWPTCLAICALLPLLMYSNPAAACVEPPLGWQDLKLWDVESNTEMPEDGVIVFFVRFGGGDFDLSVVVTHDQEEITGDLEMVELPRIRTSPPWLQCPPELVLTNYLGVWRPDSPFAVGEVYDLEITATEGVGPSDTTERQVTRELLVVDVPSDLSTPEVEALTVQARSVGEEYECCTCAECCGVCPGDEGRHCWFISEAIEPELTGLAQAQAFPHQVLYRVFDGDGSEAEVFWSGERSDVSVRYPVDHEGPFCLTVEAESLATGEVLASDESCVDDAAGLSFGSEGLNVPWPHECDDEEVEEPDNEPNDIAEDDSTHDAGSADDDLGVDSSAPPGRSCQQGSCGTMAGNTSPGPPLSLLVLIGICLAISRTRR